MQYCWACKEDYVAYKNGQSCVKVSNTPNLIASNNGKCIALTSNDVNGYCGQ